MTTKEKLKQEIERMPEYMLIQLYDFINSIKPHKQKKNKIRTFKLKGAFDNLNIREKAYE